MLEISANYFFFFFYLELFPTPVRVGKVGLKCFFESELEKVMLSFFFFFVALQKHA